MDRRIFLQNSLPFSAFAMGAGTTGCAFQRTGQEKGLLNVLDYGAYLDNASFTVTSNRIEWNAGGELSPDYGMVIRDLDETIIRDNVMHRAFLKEMIADSGGHGPSLVIRDNIGSARERAGTL